MRKVNGTFACENDKTLNQVVKGEFGFPGCKFSKTYHFPSVRLTTPFQM